MNKKKNISSLAVDNKQSDISLYFLEEAPAGILFINDKKELQVINHQARLLFGIENRIDSKTHYLDVLSDYILGFSIKEALDKKKSINLFGIDYRTSEGSIKKLMIKSRYLPPNTSGAVEPEGLLICISDITNSLKPSVVNQRIETLEEMRSMGSTICHDLKNPLAGIKGFACLLEKDLENSPSLHRMISRIIRGSDDLDNIITESLSASHGIGDGFKETDLVQLIKDISLYTSEQLCDQKIAIEFQSKEKQLLQSVNPRKLSEALKILIEISRFGMGQNGTITVNLEVNNEETLIIFSDLESELSEEYKNRIFTPFFTARNEEKKLGLSDAFNIIKTHNGTIKMISQFEGVTSLVVSLPHNLNKPL